MREPELYSSFWSFLGRRKRYWLVPMISVVLFFLLLVALTRDSREAFVYTLF